MCERCKVLERYLVEAEVVIKNLLLADDEHEKDRQRAKATQMKVTLAALMQAKH